MAKLLFVTDHSTGSRLASLCKQGKIRRLHAGIYTTDLQYPILGIIAQNWLAIVAHIVPGCILSFRSAHDLRLIPYRRDHIVFVTSTYSKTIILPGLQIKIIKGNRNRFTEHILPNVARSNEARMLLENLSVVRGSQYKHIKTIGKEGVELYLAKCLRNRHEASLNKIRDEAKIIAQELKLTAEFKILTLIISSLLATTPDAELTTSFAKALVKKEPFDHARMQLFSNLSLYLQKNSFIIRNYDFDKTSFKNIAFFESYFSNYIEGTKFELDEAEEIVFAGKLINHRHADSHDVLAHFRISNEYLEISKTPNTPKEFLELLQTRHATLMQDRPDIDPGHFKTRRNRAGSTVFVDPQDVIGTLTHAFELYALLEDGFKKALFMHFILAEIHPFNDGNGRIARIMMNAELVKAQQYKVIIPTVYRDSYLDSLRLVSRDQYFQTYCKVMDVAQAFVATIPWIEYIEAREKIEADAANLEADEGITRFNRVIRTLQLSELQAR